MGGKKKKEEEEGAEASCDLCLQSSGQTEALKFCVLHCSLETGEMFLLTEHLLGLRVERLESPTVRDTLTSRLTTEALGCCSLRGCLGCLFPRS